jgi:hypothetical protein
MCASKVGHIFVGETERRLLASKNDYPAFTLCTIRLVKLKLFFANAVFAESDDNTIAAASFACKVKKHNKPERCEGRQRRKSLTTF